MKFLPTIVLLFVVWLPAESHAQFKFRFPNGGGGGGQGGRLLPNLGRQVQNQLRREVQNQGGRLLRDFDRALGGGHRVLPVDPVEPPYEIVDPIPSPRPRPCPDPIIDPGNGGGHGGGCRIVPQPITEPEPSEPQPTKPEPTEPLTQVESGQVVTLEDGKFGDEVGAVLVKIDELVLTAKLLDWSNEKVEAKMPHLPMAGAAEAVVAVINSDGEIAEAISIELLPPSQLESKEAETEDELPVVYSGQEVAIDGAFGVEQGKVEIHIGKLVLSAKVVDWTADETTVQIPELNFDEPVSGSLHITNSEGELAEELDVMLHPAESEEDVALSDQ